MSADVCLPRGLPERLPDGERLLWQGAPDWRVLARQALHVRGLALYFGVIVAYCFGSAALGGTPLAQASLSTAKLTGVALLPIVFLTAYAWAVGRVTVYSVTNRRVVIQLGLTLPMAINLPFEKIDTAALNMRANGFGDICLLLNSMDKLAYLVLWPHARPWRLARPEPMLRAVPDAARVGQLLARALASAADMPVPAVPDARSGHVVAGSKEPVAA